VPFWRFQSLPDVLARWGHELPPERVHVVTVPPPGGARDELWRRYCAAFGIDPAWAPLQSEEHNASMGIEEAALTRALNPRLRRAGLDSDSYRRIVREGLIQETLARRPGKRRVTLPPKVHGWVDAVTGEWLAYLGESQVEVLGDVDDLRPRWPSEDAPWRDPDRPRPSRVADAALDALTAAVLDAAARPNPLESTTARIGRAARRLRGE
jgi:hypothetical protein